MADVKEARPRRKFRPGWILAKVAFYAALILSLLVFPSGLPWMLLGWGGAAAVQFFRGKAAWPILGACVVLVAVRRFDWAPGLLVLGLVMIAAAGLDFAARRGKGIPRKVFSRIVLPALGVAWIGMAWNWHATMHTSRRPALVPDRPVVCVGDSLTVFGFPRILADRLRIPVLDRSTGGITSEQALEKIPEILERNPQVVVIELGGHDFIQKRAREATRKNLERFIEAARGIGAEVILFEIPRGFVYDSYSGLERELARKHDLEVIPDTAIRNLVIWSPLNPTGEFFRSRLSYDGLHPNDRGHLYLADRVTEALVRLYGEGILK